MFKVITATDHGEPPRSAVCSIFVKVLDKNDNDPGKILGSKAH